MSVLTAMTVAALLIASPSVSDADRVAANGGFLLGNAHRCGIAADRVVRAGQLIRNLILVSAADGREEEDATARFARFFLVSAVADAAPVRSGPDAAAPSCRKVTKELERLERHGPVGDDAKAAAAGAAKAPFRLGDGE